MYNRFYLSRERRILAPHPICEKPQESSTLLGVNEQDDTFKDPSTKELDDTINELCKRFVFLDIDKELSMWGGKHNDTDILTEIGWCT